MTGSVGLLISILMLYPEVATINFNPGKRLLRFTFIYSKVLADSELNNLKEKLMESIEVYNLLEGKKTRVVTIESQICDNLTIIEVQRDVDTLVQGEITLIVELFRQYLNDNLVTEVSGRFFEEDLIAQEELIGRMLESMKSRSQDKYLFAFRDEGKVLVFDK